MTPPVHLLRVTTRPDAVLGRVLTKVRGLCPLWKCAWSSTPIPTPEHPEWIAERLIRFAKLVGRENVMAGADCGFSSQALYKTEVHPSVVWEKFKAMRQGADLATKRLWN
jgi:hypothetical protein